MYYKEHIALALYLFYPAIRACGMFVLGHRQYSCEVSWPAVQNNPIKVPPIKHTQGRDSFPQTSHWSRLLLPSHQRLCRSNACTLFSLRKVASFFFLDKRPGNFEAFFIFDKQFDNTVSAHTFAWFPALPRFVWFPSLCWDGERVNTAAQLKNYSLFLGANWQTLQWRHGFRWL